MSDPVIRLNVALEGRYRIERELGEGGMATVYLADDLKHERKVALKVLKPELAAVVGAERFLDSYGGRACTRRTLRHGARRRGGGSLKALSKKRGRKRERNPLEEKVAQVGAREHSPREGAPEGAPDHRRPGKSCRAAGIEPRGRDELMKATQELAKYVGVKPACAALRVPRATFLSSSESNDRASAAPPDPRPGLEREGTRQGFRHPVL